MTKRQKQEAEQFVPTALSQIDQILRDNKEDHYNFEEEVYFRVPTGSIEFDVWTGGGLPCGIHRFCGASESGKTCATLEVVRNFQNTIPNGFVVWFRSEGRLDPDVLARSCVDTSPEKFKVVDSNVYNFIIDTIIKLVKNNPTKTKYFFVIDSVDGLITKEEADAASFGDAKRIGGGAAVASAAMKILGLPIHKMGHMCILISQVRAKDISIGPYQKAKTDDLNSTGGNALVHAADFILQFDKKAKADLIFEGTGKEEKIAGHWCKVRILKSTNETSGNSFKYPIKRFVKGRPAVWLEYEIDDFAKKYGIIKQSAAWLSFSESFIQDAKNDGIELPEKIQGSANFVKYLEENPKERDYIVEAIKTVIIE